VVSSDVEKCRFSGGGAVLGPCDAVVLAVPEGDHTVSVLLYAARLLLIPQKIGHEKEYQVI